MFTALALSAKFLRFIPLAMMTDASDPSHWISGSADAPERKIGLPVIPAEYLEKPHKILKAVVDKHDKWIAVSEEMRSAVRAIAQKEGALSEDEILALDHIYKALIFSLQERIDLNKKDNRKFITAGKWYFSSSGLG